MLPWALAVAVLATTCAATDLNEHDQTRARMIDEINSRPGVLWKAGVNPMFKGLPVGASKGMSGVLPGSKEQLRERVANGSIGLVPKKAHLQMPESFDSATQWPQCAKIIGDIRDQSASDCCWAVAAAETASDRLCIATNASVMVPLSAQEACFCPTAWGAARGCNGGHAWAAWDYIQYEGLSTGNQYKNSGPFSEQGLCSSFSLPVCHHYGPKRDDPYPDHGGASCPRCDRSPACPTSCDDTAQAPYNDFANYRYRFHGQYQTIAPDADTIAEQIMKYGPVEASFTVSEDFENYVGGIYHPVSGKAVGGHAIKIVGWGVENGVKYWRAANSWNPYWGEQGYFRIRRGNNDCGIESEVIASAGDVTWAGPSIGSAPTSGIVV